MADENRQRLAFFIRLQFRLEHRQNPPAQRGNPAHRLGMPKGDFVGHDRALAESHQEHLLRLRVIFLRRLYDEIQQQLAARLQVIGFAVVGTFALLAKPLVTPLLHHHRRPHRQVVVLAG
ncbi:hypothetical protein D3C76_1073710 [compost metagenome]